jgi:DNA-binding NarL/FixJ family response regulator
VSLLVPTPRDSQRDAPGQWRVVVVDPATVTVSEPLSVDGQDPLELVAIDIELANGDTEADRQLVEALPGTRVVVLGVDERRQTIICAIESAALPEAPLAPNSTMARITPRERETLVLVSEGLSARQIALRLGVGERTVHTHIDHLYRKIGVNNRVEAVREGVRLGIVTFPPVGEPAMPMP